MNSLKKIFGGKMFIVSVSAVSIIAIIIAFQYRRSTQALSYIAPTSSTTAAILVAQDLPEGDWQKLIAQVNGKSTVNNTPASSTITNPTQTDIISKEILARFILSNQRGEAITVDSANKIADDILAYANSVDTPLKQYSQKDVLVSNDTSKDSLTAYKDNINAVIVREDNNVGDELVIMEQALSQNDYTNINKLKTISAGYKATAQQLLKVRVPKPLADDHLKLINFYMLVSKNVAGFTNLKVDPFVASLNFKSYVDANKEYQSIILDMYTYLSSAGVDMNS